MSTDYLLFKQYRILRSIGLAKFLYLMFLWFCFHSNVNWYKEESRPTKDLAGVRFIRFTEFFIAFVYFKFHLSYVFLKNNKTSKRTFVIFIIIYENQWFKNFWTLRLYFDYSANDILCKSVHFETKHTRITVFFFIFLICVHIFRFSASYTFVFYEIFVVRSFII